MTPSESKLVDALKAMDVLYQKDKIRLDFLDLILKTGIPIGLKPGFHALVGSTYIEGANNTRDLIDKLIRINNEEEPIPDASSSRDTKEESTTQPKK